MENLTGDKRPILVEFAEKTVNDLAALIYLSKEAKDQIAEIIFRNAEEFKLHYRAPAEELR